MTFGTYPPIYRRLDADGTVAEVGKSYITLQFATVQVVSEGGFFSAPQRVVVASQVEVGYTGQEKLRLSGLQHTQEVKRGDAPESIALTRNLVSALPTNLTYLNVDLDIILDQKNLLVPLVSLINGGTFNPVLDAVPGASQVAGTVGKIASEIMGAYGVKAETTTHLIRFRGTFNLLDKQFRSGYYIFLGTQEASLPTSTAKVELNDDKWVLINGSKPQHMNYAVLYAQVAKTRGRYSNPNAEWLKKLMQAEDDANNLMYTTPTEKERASTLKACLELIKEGRVLLRSDPAFIESERDAIVQESFLTVQNSLRPHIEAVRRVAAASDPTLKSPMVQGLSAGVEDVASEARTDELSRDEKNLLGVQSMQALLENVTQYKASVAKEHPEFKERVR